MVIADACDTGVLKQVSEGGIDSSDAVGGGSRGVDRGLRYNDVGVGKFGLGISDQLTVHVDRVSDVEGLHIIGCELEYKGAGLIT